MSQTLEDFASEFHRCWLCGTFAIHTWPPRLEIHHIVRGPNRAKVREERCTLIRTCQRCHMRRLDSMAVARQLAIKALHDPGYYDRRRVNELRNRAPDAISAEEVAKEIDDLRRDFGQHESVFPYPQWKQ